MHAVPLDRQRGGDVSVPEAIAVQLPDAALSSVPPMRGVQHVACPGLVVGAVFHAVGEALELARRVVDRVEVPAV